MNWFVFIVFVVMPLVGAIFAWKSWHLSRTGVRVHAKIVDYERQGTYIGGHSIQGDRRPKYRPVVSFVDEKHKSHTVKLSKVYSHEPLNVGNSMPIIYPRGRPDKAQSAALWSIWFIAYWFCAPAVTIIVFIGSQWIWYRYIG
ncbi:MAG: DUF3592 domain-containing protein [Casimicrobium sp.]